MRMVLPVLTALLLVAPAHADEKRPARQCLPKDATEYSPDAMPVPPGAELYACFSATQRPTCVFVHPDTGAMRFEGWPDPPLEPSTLALKALPTGARLCKLDAQRRPTKDCRTIEVDREDPGLDPVTAEEAEEWGSADDIGAEIDDTGTLLLLTWFDAEAIYVETWSLGDKDRRIASLKLAEREGCAPMVNLVGQSLLVRETCESKEMAWLATPKGKKIAAVGGKKPMRADSAPARVSGNLWAFLGNDGRVIVQDVKTGKVKLRTTKVDPPGEKAATLVGLADGRVGVFYAGAGDKRVVVVDPAKGKLVQTWTIARCTK